MQVYIDAYETLFNKVVFKLDQTAMDISALTEIWKRVIDVIFTNIYKKLEGSEAAKKR